MSFYLLDGEQVHFPNPLEAEPEGLLAMGGDLSTERLLLAYRMGIFPWYSAGYPLLWWSPDPRMVLIPGEMHISKSLNRLLKQDKVRILWDGDFAGVIGHCAMLPRPGQDGTWITEEMKTAYLELYHLGYAHCLEVFYADELAGGLYGVSLGQSFFGESMFSLKRDGSKVAFAWLNRFCQQHEFQLIDCQNPTQHLANLGAKPLARAEFLERLARANQGKSLKGSWQNLGREVLGF